MAEGAAVAAIGGTIMQIEGQRKASRAEAAAARRNAEQRRLEAIELIDRFNINTAAIKGEGEVAVSNQMLSAAARGVDVGSGSALDTFEQTRAMVAKEIANKRKEVMFQAQQLARGAANDIRYANERRRASQYQQLGTFLRGAGQVAGAFS